MEVRSVANGNIIDLPADHGLVTAGIYVPVEYAEPEAPAESEPEVTEPEPEPEPVAETVDYAAMAYNDLRALAAARGLSPKGRKKQDVIRALEGADG